MTFTNEIHEANAKAKADRAMNAIELVAATMVNQGAAVDRQDALSRVGLALTNRDPEVRATMWAQIGLAAGHIEGVTVRSTLDVDRLPTYRTSTVLILERLEARITAAEAPADPFDGLLS